MDNYFDNLIFLTNLDLIEYIDRDKISEEDFNDKSLDKVKGTEEFNKSTKQYWVGFPSDVIIDENKQENSFPASNTPFYDHDSEGSVRFMDL